MAEDIKVGEVYYLPVRVTSRNENMEREYLAVEPVGMEVPEQVLAGDAVAQQLTYRHIGFGE